LLVSALSLLIVLLWSGSARTQDKELDTGAKLKLIQAHMEEVFEEERSHRQWTGGTLLVTSGVFLSASVYGVLYCSNSKSSSSDLFFRVAIFLSHCQPHQAP